ncbi:histidine kinase [Marinitoga sp. 38H-ov]|uniref:sensor histidine kinase n=1 Tax=Marinitoga sp. 38H-ov TaxID=1755814 RepID=UPI0013EA80E0|nr:histidine kinase [Marinitoga sp. 38H-ov]KAF2955619.1 hypothetical protein AS160_00450 [Marinitoga sp. 38H-ov]
MMNKIFIITQIFALIILAFIYIFSPYFNLVYGILIAEVFTISIGFIYYLLIRILELFIKIEVIFFSRVIKIIIFIISFFSGIIISEYFMSNILAFNLFPSYKYLFVISIIILFFFVFFNIIIYIKLNNEIRKNERLKNEKLKAELNALRSKLNPHFLFNTLNTLLEISQESPECVEKIIINLSDIYRKILYTSSNDMISLEEELELIKKYLEIEKIRLGKRLDYEFNIDNNLLNYRIPPLILEPLVENSVIHGISKKKDGGKITISFYKKNNEIIFEISDEGIGKIEDLNFGFGLSSIKNRLDLIFNNSELIFKQNIPSGIKAEIIIRG